MACRSSVQAYCEFGGSSGTSGHNFWQQLLEFGTTNQGEKLYSSLVGTFVREGTKVGVYYASSRVPCFVQIISWLGPPNFPRRWLQVQSPKLSISLASVYQAWKWCYKSRHISQTLETCMVIWLTKKRRLIGKLKRDDGSSKSMMVLVFLWRWGHR